MPLPLLFAKKGTGR